MSALSCQESKEPIEQCARGRRQSPAHFIHSRLLMDYLYPVPFVLLWLWCLLKFDETEKPSLCMGRGIHAWRRLSYIAAVAFLPLYLMFTWLYLSRETVGCARLI
jgi:hypothetical protein